MPLFSPVLARGIQYSRTISAISIGARTATMSSAQAGFTVGRHLFAMAADFTLADYLGKITLNSGTTINFQYPNTVSRSGTHILVTPESMWKALTVPGLKAYDPESDLGVETLETAGAELIHTRVRDQREFLGMTIGQAQRSDWSAYKAFVKNDLEGALLRFTAAYFDHDDGQIRCDLVKMRDPAAMLVATHEAYILRTWNIALQIVQQNTYAG